MSPVDSGFRSGHHANIGRRRGATYLELIAVLLVVAIMGSVAVPNTIEFMARQKLHSAAEQVRQAILETTVVAETSGVSQELIFVEGSGKILIPGRQDPQTRLAPWTINLKQIDPQITIEFAEFDTPPQAFLAITDGGRVRSEGKVRLRLNQKRIELGVSHEAILIGDVL